MDLFSEIGKTMILATFESEVEFYNEHKQVIDLISWLVDLFLE